jgi:hypothetical protein
MRYLRTTGWRGNHHWDRDTIQVMATILTVSCIAEHVVLSAQESDAIWTMVKEHSDRWISVVYPLFARSCPEMRQRMWDDLAAHAMDSLPLWCITLWSLVPPSLVPDVVPALTRILQHTPTGTQALGLVHARALATLREWMDDPDPDVRAHAVILLESYDLFGACVSPHRIVAMHAWDLVARMPSRWSDPVCQMTMQTVLATAPDDDISERVLALWERMIATSPDHAWVAQAVHRIWSLLGDPRIDPKIRVRIAQTINRLLAYPSAAFVIRSFLEPVSSWVPHVPDHAIAALGQGRWEIIGRDVREAIVAYGIQSARHALVRDLLIDGWKEEAGEWIIGLLHHPDIPLGREDRLAILCYGMGSLHSTHVSRMVRQWLHTDDDAYVLYAVLCATVVMQSPDPSSRPMSLPSWMLPVLQYGAATRPDILPASIIGWIWDTDEGAACALIHQMVQTGHPAVVATAVQGIGYGWGRRTDPLSAAMLRGVIDYLHTVMSGEDRRTIGNAVIDTIVAACGRTAPDILVGLFVDVLHLIAQFPQNGWGRRIGRMWGRGHDATMRSILHQMIPHASPELCRIIADMIGAAWGYGADHDIIDLCRSILIVACGGTTNDAIAGTVIDRVLQSMCGGIGPTTIPVVRQIVDRVMVWVHEHRDHLDESQRERIAASCTCVLLSSADVEQPEETTRRLCMIHQISPHGVRCGMRRWIDLASRDG